MYQFYIQPYTTKTAMGKYIYPAPKAIVEPGNPVGGAFTLPTEFINFTGTFTITPKTGWPGYTTITKYDYYNGPGVFEPNHGATGPTRVVFPTTMGNPYPTYTSTDQKWINGNYGDGNPVTPTTTFNGLYDMSRGGSITVTPGPRRFGGTFRLFYRPEAYWYQYIYYYTPAIYKAYGDFSCLDEGMFDCTPGTFKSSIGDTTAGFQATWYLLNVTGTGTGKQTRANTAKATAPTTPYGTDRTPYGNASFITGMRRYLNLIHPWTTGFAKVHNPVGSPNIITPQAQGYDISLGGADITVTHYDRVQVWSPEYSSSSYYTTTTKKQYLYGVTRVVSMVRPRLIHSYTVRNTLAGLPNTWQAARLWSLKVFFLPEPGGMLMLGAGIAALLGLSRIRMR
jgi:hypothetical protein